MSIQKPLLLGVLTLAGLALTSGTSNAQYTTYYNSVPYGTTISNGTVITPSYTYGNGTVFTPNYTYGNTQYRVIPFNGPTVSTYRSGWNVYPSFGNGNYNTRYISPSQVWMGGHRNRNFRWR